MPTFIKPGFWKETCNPCNGYKGWLNLDQFSGQSGTNGTSGTSGVSGEQGVQGIQGIQGIQGVQGVTGSSGTNGTSGLTGDRYQTTSSSSFTLGTGGTITIGTGLAYTIAQDVLIAYNLPNHQISEVISYNPATGVLVFGTPSEVFGSGTYTSWGVNLNGAAGGNGTNGTSGTSGLSASNGTSGTSGIQGIQGVQGIQGIQGVNGTSGTSGLTGTNGTSGINGTSGSSGVSNATASYGLFAQTVDSTPVTATAVETTIIGPGVGTLTVPANAFSIGDSFQCALDGIISCTSASTVHIRIKTLSGALLADTGIIDLAAATNKAWIMNLYFTIRTLGTATVASISSGGLFSYIRNGGTQFEGYNLSTVNITTFDTTVINTLVITAQWDDASANNSITSRNFTLTKVY